MVRDNNDGDVHVAENAADGEQENTCRSLICDKNGVIVAEMIYRCLICATVTESIAAAQKHYQARHFGRGRPGLPAAALESLDVQDPDVLVPDCQLQYDEDMDDQDDASSTHHEDASSGDKKPNANANSTSTADNADTNSNRTHAPPLIKPAMRRPISLGHHKAGNGHNQGAGRSSLNGSGTGENVTHRGGYVTCAVCNITKFYASVQRRYGQFTCMGCAKFFGRYLLKPRRYLCPALGSCPLDMSPRCKACLLLACITTYHIDDKRMKIVNANRPLKRSPTSGQQNGALGVLPAMVAASSSHNGGDDTMDSGDEMPTDLSTTGAGSAANYSAAHSPSTSTSDHNLSPTPTSSLRYDENSALDMKKPLVTNHSVVAPPLTPNYENNIGHSGSKSLLLHHRHMQQRQRLSLPTGHLQHSGQKHPLTNGLSMLAAAARARVGAASGRKVSGCRSCVNCLADDCGQCNYCLDKPKFGGPNTLKKKCVQKKCQVSTHAA